MGGRPADATIFSVVLRPHRSLTKRGFLVVIGIFGGFMLVTGAAFFAIGAWPVVGFMGLEIALVFAAFRLSFRSAHAAQEIRLTRHRLSVRETTASGLSTETNFNPYWARLEIARRPEYGIVAMRIASHGLRLEIGRFLPLPQREPVAAALTAALAEARAAPV